MDDCGDWAEDVFGSADLGDARRTSGLVRMATEAMRWPSGKISEVYASPAERQGAYDFIESPEIEASAIESIAAGAFHACGIAATGKATCRSNKLYGQLDVP